MRDRLALLSDLDQNDTEVLEKLASEGRSWIVGGWIRDGLIREGKRELDIATDLPPEDVVKIFPNSLTHGAKYGTVVVRIPGSDSEWEVTTLRTESEYNDGRRPDVVNFGTGIMEDLSRRDFTVNAMAVSYPDGEFIDPFGGLSDLESKIIRAVGSASERFSEDGLRILRAYRFVAVSEGWEIEEETEAGLGDSLQMLDSVSAERIGTEFRKMLELPGSGRSISIMAEQGALQKILPGSRPPENYSPTGKLAVDLAVMFSNGGVSKEEAVLRSRQGLKATNAEISSLELLMGIEPETSLISVEEVRRFHAAISPAQREDVLDYLEVIGHSRRQYVDAVEQPDDRGHALIDGRMLAAETLLQPGVRLGRLKDFLYRIQIERGLSDRSEILGLISEIDWENEDPSSWPKMTWP
jgi:tRNA nucleotidyltransferase/poly(A) polymerase